MHRSPAVVLLAAAVIGCTARTPSPPAPSESPPLVVAFGDSLTSGPGLRPSETYPALLQQRITADGLPHRVINAGHAGDTTTEALGRLDAALAPGTRILIVALGINDGLRGAAVSIVEQNLGTIIERAKSRNIHVLLCAMEAPPIGGFGYSIEFHRAFTRLAERFQVPVVPFFLTGVAGRPDLNLEDRFHPNAAGHRVIAETIWRYLRPMLLSPATGGAL